MESQVAPALNRPIPFMLDPRGDNVAVLPDAVVFFLSILPPAASFTGKLRPFLHFRTRADLSHRQAPCSILPHSSTSSARLCYPDPLLDQDFLESDSVCLLAQSQHLARAVVVQEVMAEEEVEEEDMEGSLRVHSEEVVQVVDRVTAEEDTAEAEGAEEGDTERRSSLAENQGNLARQCSDELTARERCEVCANC